MNRFEEKLAAHAMSLKRAPLHTLQVNVGRKCNQACRHCHVDAAPWRTEMMSLSVAKRVANWIQEHRPKTVDITGGAPELSEHFCFLLETARRAGCEVIDRNNLTILEKPEFEWLPAYLAKWQTTVIASLPCYSEENVARQRGAGVFEKSISGLRKLNAVGYGRALPLHLVYNPVGPKLPGPQSQLEADYKDALEKNYGIVFNQLFTITNQPIARFAEDLARHGHWDDYLELLAQNFNPSTISGLMCRAMISVGYGGEIYDCDFNQMLGMGIGREIPLHLWDINPGQLAPLRIRTGVHCLACSAGAGSSCTGAVS